MTIVSGPAKTEAIWQLVRTLLFLGVAGYFLYDGAYGWPHENVTQARAELQKAEPWDGKLTYEDLPDLPTNVEFDALKKSGVTRLDQVIEKLGTPQIERRDGPTRTIRYFVSKWGYAVISFDSGGADLAGAQWKDWFKPPSEIKGQFYWALVPGLPGLIFLWFLIKALTLKVVLDDRGLTYAGELIPFEAMTGLRGYNPKGWIDLYYKVGEEGKKRRLDNEKFLLFDEIVAGICEKMGYINEVEVHKAEQARRHADEQAAEAGQQDSEDQSK